jgi:hypothetical protein
MFHLTFQPVGNYETAFQKVEQPAPKIVPWRKRVGVECNHSWDFKDLRGILGSIKEA